MRLIILILVTLSLLCTVCACGADIAPPERDIGSVSESTPAMAASTAPLTTGELYRRHMEQYAVGFSANDMSALGGVDFEPYSVILVGEIHQVSSNTEVKLAFLKYLHEQHGVRFLIEEMGYGSGMQINKFLQTGDKTLLTDFYTAVVGRQGATQESYEFYLRLGEYNLSLPEEERITVLGVDIQSPRTIGLSALHGLTEDKGAPPPEAEEAYRLLAENRALTEAELAAMMEQAEQHEDGFRAYLAEDYDDFYFTLRSVLQSAKFAEEKGSEALRERYLCDNFRSLYEHYGIDRCFGMFGSVHASRNAMFGTHRSFAGFLSRDYEPTKDKVLSMVCVYDQCEVLDTLSGASSKLISAFGGSALAAPFAEAVGGDFGLCPAGGLTLATEHIDEKYQYLICIKSSPACAFFKAE